jgi:capsular polysaccharide transport system ATP-binding protein
MIRFQNVTKIYKANSVHRIVLDNVSMSLDPMKRYGVMGRNGAGKSTLLRLVAGTDIPTRGTVKRNVRVSWPIGFGGGFHTMMTGRENVVFVSRIYGADPRRVLDFVQDFSELGSYIDVRLQAYSSGMQARLAFGLSMAIDFDFYLVDEVLAVGDARFQARCIAAFAERRRHSGMMMVSHQFVALARNCEAALLFDRGRLLYFEDINDAAEYYKQSE